MDKNNNFDVLVIGGGHAGIEAACAAARMGCKTGLITISKNKIGHMPCNPAVGGIGKGHIVFEIAALGGIMPQLCTKTYLQANMLNQKKGPAVQGLRLQIDKIAYAKEAQKMLENYPNLTIIEGMVKEVMIENNSIKGLLLENGTVYHSSQVIVTTGTFLNGLVHKGLINETAGRENEKASTFLTQSLQKHNIIFGRLKTGTPPRLEKTSVDFSVMEEQGSHQLNCLFEFHEHKVNHKHSCYITHTNKNTHEIIKKNAHLSPIYRGDIKGIAPRYCPSIEDKISRFSLKETHHIFVEPESLSLNEVYPNGLSTSLPIEAQLEFIRSIKGFENAIIARPGYAIEYDFIYPNQLKHTLEVKNITGLFTAGQINGTTGYEEAAGQGIIAGINAAAQNKNLPPFIIHREEGYIGVMIDDLVTLSVDEPYRMFTSRAERRLLLRQDNTFYRLYKKAFDYGLITEELYHAIDKEYATVTKIINLISQKKGLLKKVAEFTSDGEDDKVKEIIKEYGKEYTINERMMEYLFAELLYLPYNEREKRESDKIKEFREMIIPATFNYAEIPGLSIELQQKLHKARPQTIAQAQLISGITPAALSLLIFKVKREKS